MRRNRIQSSAGATAGASAGKGASKDASAGQRLARALRVPFAFLPLVAAASTLVLVADGCGSMACLEWSADRGPCPSRDEAFKRFGGQSCVADIVSVDSDAEADETACCYDVTKRAKGEAGCGTPDSQTGVTAGGTSGSGSCGGCAAFRDGTASDLCPGSVDVFNSLVSCLCSGACAEACDDGSCSTSFDTAECQACVADTATGCGSQMAACDNDK